MSEKQSNFSDEQQRAIERMWEMQKRSSVSNSPHPMPPIPPFVKLQSQVDTNVKNVPPEPKAKNIQEEKTNPQKQHSNTPSLFSGLGIPFLKNTSFDGDMTLIIGLLLLLANEKADRKLLLALLYILM